MNCLAQTPVLNDPERGIVLVDSWAICEYLEETVDQAPMIIGTAVHRAEIRRMTEWFDHKLRLNFAAFFSQYRDIQITTNTTDAQGMFVRLEQNVGSEAPPIGIHCRSLRDACNSRQAHHRYRGVVEDTVLELHQLHTTSGALGNLVLKLGAAELDVRSGGRTYVSRQRLARALVETERVVQEKLGEAARRKPREAAVVFQPSEGEAPIAIEAVPPEKRRFGRGAGHRLDRIPHELRNMPK